MMIMQKLLSRRQSQHLVTARLGWQSEVKVKVKYEGTDEDIAYMIYHMYKNRLLSNSAEEDIISVEWYKDGRLYHCA